MTEAKARAACEQAGLKLEVRMGGAQVTKERTKFNRTLVSAQSVRNGAQVNRNSTVTTTLTRMMPPSK